MRCCRGLPAGRSHCSSFSDDVSGGRMQDGQARRTEHYCMQGLEGRNLFVSHRGTQQAGAAKSQLMVVMYGVGSGPAFSFIGARS